ncbi:MULTISPECIES: hypothetical protein [Micromonospora]|uniref:PE family protein n=1 Tax=Micromonospora yangpuensis TaxID=683228 RepID=A0A1C6U607_9ACTN|nr:hypothetical protein [Micromonospora yangpuensis]GGL91040.1 hypothetical protein GCM10012279_06080 [Micromonospora yangpuensis]SCL49525.1 hypothetical protein GA0070617_1208 [Micromonospora yangpuensis]
MIPEEDRPASWLSGYGSIEADIRQLREFAVKLEAEVQKNYAPHLAYIAHDMQAKLPNPCDAFIELVHFLRAHHETQQATTDTVYAVGGMTGRLAQAAGTVAREYEKTDAFSAARVGDVEQALAGAHTPALPVPAPRLVDPTGPDDAGPVVLP